MTAPKGDFRSLVTDDQFLQLERAVCTLGASECYLRHPGGHARVLNRLLPVIAEIRAGDSDGHHTFTELYDYRMLYNAMAANAHPELSVKSWRHHTGEECFRGGWFIVVMNLPAGQVSNHYRARWWDYFRIPDMALAPEWDGHDPAEAARRMHAHLAPTGGAPS